MVILLARLVLALTGNHTESSHERAHVACECAVYLLVSPEARDDANTPIGEAIASLACRADGP